FELYIPKWRVPTPCPSRISVGIFPRRTESADASNLTPVAAQGDASLRNEPIVATVVWYSEHTKTIRYRPTGDHDTWEIGEPYIPDSLTAGGSPRLRMIVLWDLV